MITSRTLMSGYEDICPKPNNLTTLMRSFLQLSAIPLQNPFPVRTYGSNDCM
jgi:hypothetical protein